MNELAYGGKLVDPNNLPRVFPDPSAVITYRGSPDDFIVEEQLGFVPDGFGTHSWLLIEKVNVSTDEAAARLSSHLGVYRKDIGYAGKKDTIARVRQWMTVPLQDVLAGPVDKAISILKVTKNQRKLKVGQLAGNRFELRVQIQECRDLDTRLKLIKRYGFPNYFGIQRFGRKGQNLLAARRLAHRDPKGHRRLHPREGMFASAARSAAFNSIVGRRILDGAWLSVQENDVVILNGLGSHFQVGNDEVSQINDRISRGELSPTAPLAGRRTKTSARQAEDERRIILEDSTLGPWLIGLFREEERRSVRILPKNLEWDWIDTTLTLVFELPKGAFATALLNELGEIKEANA